LASIRIDACISQPNNVVVLQLSQGGDFAIEEQLQRVILVGQILQKL
jgi:hypothetical protein